MDKLFSAIDIVERVGFASFLCVNEACFRVIAEQSLRGSYSHQTLLDMVKRLGRDLDVLGIKPLRCDIALPKQIDPLAIDYLVAGSRLGSNVLRKRWSSSADLKVLRANNYFSTTVDILLWKKTCDALAQIRIDSARACAIERDTRSLFDLFLAVSQHSAAREALT